MTHDSPLTGVIFIRFGFSDGNLLCAGQNIGKQ